MSTCNRLDLQRLQTLGSQPMIMPQKSPRSLTGSWHFKRDWDCTSGRRRDCYLPGANWQVAHDRYLVAASLLRIHDDLHPGNPCTSYWNPVDLMSYSNVNFMTFSVITKRKCHICDIVVLNKFDRNVVKMRIVETNFRIFLTYVYK